MTSNNFITHIYMAYNPYAIKHVYLFNYDIYILNYMSYIQIHVINPLLLIHNNLINYITDSMLVMALLCLVLPNKQLDSQLFVIIEG